MVLSLFVFGLVGWLLLESRQETERHALTRAESLARLYADRFAATLMRLDASLDEIADHVPPFAEDGKGESDALAEAIRRELRDFPEVSAFDATTPEGRFRLLPPALVGINGLGELACFQPLLEGRSDRTIYSAVLRDPLEGGWRLLAARAVRRDGRFLGAVVALFDLEYFQRLAEEIDIGEKGALAVRRSDDWTLVLRRPVTPEKINTPTRADHPLILRLSAGQKSGAMLFPADADGTERYYGFLRLERHPFFVAIGLEKGEVLQRWQRHAVATVALTALALALIWALVWRLASRERVARESLVRLERSEAELRQTQERLQQLVEISSDWIWEQDAELRFTYFSTGLARGGGKKGEFLGKHRWDLPIDVPPEKMAEHRALLEAHQPFRDFEYRIFLPDKKEWRWYSISGEPQYDGEGRFIGYRGTGKDITERKEYEARLFLLASVFEHSGEALMITDADNRILEVNPAFTRLTGYTLEEVRGRNPKILASGHTKPEVFAEMWRALAEKGFWQGEVWDRRKDGEVYPKLLTITVVRPSGRPLYYIASFADITLQKASEAQARHIAHHDMLTGLPNRLNLQGRLEQAVAVAQRNQQQLAVMFIDLDQFKTINDTLGHAAGDELLVQVAHRLKGSVRDSDIVARLGGDEFVVVVTGLSVRTATVQVAEKILKALAQPFNLSGVEVVTTPSIGIALFPDDGEDVGALMKAADAAMYQAKSVGRNTYRFFTAEIAANASERLRIEAGLRQALREKAFTLAYQPKVDGHGRCVGFEALLRWTHPEWGPVSPAQFVPIAEEAGLMHELGTWVLDEACRQLAEWRSRSLMAVTVAVNVSAHQLRRGGFAQLVTETLSRYDLVGEDLELELTESVAMENPEEAATLLNELSSRGVKLAIDDFGTGYSSLAYLKRLPLSALKLDRSFVVEIERNASDATICAATIALAHSLGLKVVAEGVESERQRDFLAQLGCDFFQGYLFGKPLTAAEAEAFVQRRQGVDDDRL